MAVEWFYQELEESLGSVSSDHLRKLAAQGVICCCTSHTRAGFISALLAAIVLWSSTSCAEEFASKQSQVESQADVLTARFGRYTVPRAELSDFRPPWRRRPAPQRDTYGDIVCRPERKAHRPLDA